MKFENIKEYRVCSQEDFTKFCVERMTDILSWIVFELGGLHDYVEPAIKGIVKSHFSSMICGNHFSVFFSNIYTDGENVYDFEELPNPIEDFDEFDNLWEPDFEEDKIEELVIEELLKLYNLHHIK